MVVAQKQEVYPTSRKSEIMEEVLKEVLEVSTAMRRPVVDVGRTTNKQLDLSQTGNQGGE